MIRLSSLFGLCLLLALALWLRITLLWLILGSRFILVAATLLLVFLRELRGLAITANVSILAFDD